MSAEKFVSFLSRVLRHDGPKLNLEISIDGYIEVDSIIDLEPDLSLEMIKQIVETKNWHYKHFELKEENGKFFVRAVHGHSIVGLDYDKILTEVDPEKYSILVYATSLKEWQQMEKEEKLKPTGIENLIYFLTNHPKNDRQLRSHEVFVEIDMPRAVKDGIKFYQYPKGIATPGSLDKKYIKNVLKEITKAEECSSVVHVIAEKDWKRTQTMGLQLCHKEINKFLKFSNGHPAPCDDEVRIEIDLKKALKDGVKFYFSSDGTILSPCNILPKNFGNVIAPKAQTEINTGAIPKTFVSTVRKRERQDSRSSVEMAIPDEIPTAIYGTRWNMWRVIKREGLKPEKSQNLIYLSTVYPKNPEQLLSNQVYIEVDMVKAIRDGMKFNNRTKNCIATPGIKGVIAPTYFKSIMKEINFPDEYPVVVYGTVQRKLKSVFRNGIKSEHNGWAYFRNGYPKQMPHDFYVEINLRKAMGAGLKFYVTSDGSILSPEKINGTLPPKFFKSVKNRNKQEVKYDQLDDLDIWEIPEFEISWRSQKS